jgi:Sec-independent protein translocase protein TatA
VNFLGVGLVEVAVILLVGFLVLGPSRSIDMARAGGRLVRNLRSVLDDVTTAVDLEQGDPPDSGGAPPPRPDPGDAPTPRNGR